MSVSAQEIAERSAAAMWSDDNASAHLGMKIMSVAPGRAVLSMTIAPSMTNGHGTCHGGFLFMLADSAFAFACNSHNQRSVAQSCHITYVAPGRAGMELVAEAVERTRAERSGIYDVSVKTTDGQLLAEFRGLSRTVPGLLVPELENKYV